MTATVPPIQAKDTLLAPDPIHPSVSIGRMPELVGCRVAGTFCAGPVQAVTGRFHTGEVELSDYSGAALAIVPCGPSRHITLPEESGFVTAIGRVTLDSGRIQLRLKLIRPFDGPGASSAADLLCLPGEETLHGKLRALEDGLPQPLREFLIRVLLDPGVGRDFLSCRASAAHHHSQVGGLIEHCLDNLDLLAAVVARTIPGDTLSVGIAQLAYVLHDIGKLWTVGTQQRPWMSRLMPHEQANLLILAPHLDWLRKAFPEAWAGLVAVFSYLAIPAPLRKRPNYFPAEAVAMFDGWSAAKHAGNGLEKLTSRISLSLDAPERQWELVKR